MDFHSYLRLLGSSKRWPVLKGSSALPSEEPMCFNAPQPSVEVEIGGELCTFSECLIDQRRHLGGPGNQDHGRIYETWLTDGWMKVFEVLEI